MHTGPTNTGDTVQIPPLLKKVFPLVAGAGIGFAYWYFIGCTSGSCPITSTWYISTGYGALVGASWLLPTTKKRPTGTEPASGDTPS